MNATTSEKLLTRIESYLANGGLFNPEMMEHNKVRELLMDCRKCIALDADLLKNAEAAIEALLIYAHQHSEKPMDREMAILERIRRWSHELHEQRDS